MIVLDMVSIVYYIALNGEGARMPDDKNDAADGSTIFGRIWQRFGDVAKKLGLVGDADVQSALERQEGSLRGKKIGEILVEDGKLSKDHVDKVLDHQKKSGRATPPASKPPAAKKKASLDDNLKGLIGSGKKTAKKAAKKPAKKKAAKKVAKRAAKKPAPKKAAKKVAKKKAKK